MLCFFFKISYTAHVGMACRTAAGGRGTDGIDYDLTSGVSAEFCRNMCTQNYLCLQYEYYTPYGNCEIWYYTDDNYAALAGASCFVKNDSPAPQPIAPSPTSKPTKTPTSQQPYVFNIGYACRKADGGLGVRNTDYFLFTLSLEDCEDVCTFNPTCFQYEHFSSNNRCEIWVIFEDNYDAKVGFQCNVKNQVPTPAPSLPPITWQGQFNVACRPDANDLSDIGELGPEYEVFRYLGSLQACQDLCMGRADCTGVEYRPQPNHDYCEIWKVEIEAFVVQAGNSCFRKVTSGP